MSTCFNLFDRKTGIRWLWKPEANPVPGNVARKSYGQNKTQIENNYWMCYCSKSLPLFAENPANPSAHFSGQSSKSAQQSACEKVVRDEWQDRAMQTPEASDDDFAMRESENDNPPPFVAATRPVFESAAGESENQSAPAKSPAFRKSHSQRDY